MLNVQLPEVGENIESGTVVNILVAVGDVVQKDQALIELETDKASLEVPSPSAGTVQEILVKSGDDVKIGQTIITLDGNTATPAAKEAPAAAQTETPAAPQPTSQPDAPAPAPQPAATPSAPPPSAASKEVAAAPSVRRFARELGVDIAKVPGSGSAGRITKDDVKAYTKQVMSSGAGTGPATASARSLPDFTKWGETKNEPMSNIRKKTAEHLSYCWQTIPHVTQFGKADITELDVLRKKYSTKDLKLTITPFLLKVMAAALKTFPQFNSSVDMATRSIIYKDYCNIGVAVDTDRGLLVPVLRDVDQKSIYALGEELNTIAQRARDRKISLDDLQGGSMTLTNLGGIGGTAFTPIVNWPEVCILGVSRAQLEPSYSDKTCGPSLMLPLSLSYDHRVIDGADGARFLSFIIDAIKQPFLLELNK